MKYITDRQEIAYAMNFGRFPVLKINLETCKDGYDDYYEGDYVKVMTPRNGYPDMYSTGNLYLSEGRFGVLTEGACLSGSFGYTDVMEMTKVAQAPVLHAGETVVLIEDFPKKRTCRVRMMKVSDRVDPFVYPCATLEDVPDDFDTSVPKGWR